MAKIEGEMRQYLEKVGHGEEVTMYKFKTSIHGEDCHYPGELISGAKMMEKCIDCCTELSSIRDAGSGPLGRCSCIMSGDGSYAGYI